MITRFLSLFKRKKKPNLRDSFGMLDKLCDDLDNTLFYISQIKDFEFTPEEKLYISRSTFNLASIRDEIQIRYNNQKSREMYERFANRSKG